MKAISQELLKRMHEEYAADRKAHVLESAAARTDIAELAYIPAMGAKLNGEFSLELETMTVTAQEKSGRCWAFAGMNIIREIAAKKLGLKEFELSGNYIAFYDKLEKCNGMLEMVIANAEKNPGDRMMDYIAHGIWDGGYFDMFADLVEKYGIVPKSAMPETYASAHTDTFMKQLNRILRKDGMELKAMIGRGEDPSSRKEEMLSEIYKALCIVFGEPVREFDLSWRDQEKEYHIDRRLTPKSFYEKYIGIDLHDYIMVLNEPTARKPLNRLYAFHYIGNMAEKTMKFLNLSIEEVKELSISQMRDGEPVWFACDVGHFSDRKLGILDQDSFDYGAVLGGIDMNMEKGKSLEWQETYGTHAMLLIGVNFDEKGAPDRWKIENSWGKDAGQNGYYVCSDRYFTEFVYEVIIQKKYLTPAQLALLDQEPDLLMPWDM